MPESTTATKEAIAKIRETYEKIDTIPDEQRMPDDVGVRLSGLVSIARATARGHQLPQETLSQNTEALCELASALLIRSQWRPLAEIGTGKAGAYLVAEAPIEGEILDRIPAVVWMHDATSVEVVAANYAHPIILGPIPLPAATLIRKPERRGID